MIFGHPFGYRNTPLRLSQHPPPVRATLSVRISSKENAYYTSMISKKFAELTKLIKRIRYLQL
jgi:hypothetical protein